MTRKPSGNELDAYARVFLWEHVISGKGTVANTADTLMQTYPKLPEPELRQAAQRAYRTLIDMGQCYPTATGKLIQRTIPYAEEVAIAYLSGGSAETIDRVVAATRNAIVSTMAVSPSDANSIAMTSVGRMIADGRCDEMGNDTIRLSWDTREREQERRHPEAEMVRQQRRRGFKPPMLINDLPDELFWSMSPVQAYTRIHLTPAELLPWKRLRPLLPPSSQRFIKITSGITHIYVPEGYGHEARDIVVKFAESEGIELRQSPKVDRKLRSIRDLSGLPKFWVEGAVAEQTRRNTMRLTGPQMGLMTEAGYGDRHEQEMVISGWVWESLHTFDPSRKNADGNALTFPAYAGAQMDKFIKDLPRGLGSITGGSRESSDLRTEIGRAKQAITERALSAGEPIEFTSQNLATELGISVEEYQDRVQKVSITTSIASPASWEGIQESIGDGASPYSSAPGEISSALVDESSYSAITDLEDTRDRVATLSRAMARAAGEPTPSGRVNLLGLIIVHASAMGSGLNDTLSTNQVAKHLGVSPQTALASRQRLADAMRKHEERKAQ
jgi:hypothetical protein